MRVVIVGAGVAGLCTLRHFVHSGNSWHCVAFEKGSVLGGCWNYVEPADDDQHVHSSMYNSLRTNLPTDSMEFPDFPFPEQDKSVSFVHHSRVLRYLNAYADHFGLRQYIQFNTEVQLIRPLSKTIDGNMTWEVTVHDVIAGRTVTAVYDAVIVCNGHYTKPNIPNLPGLRTFQGLVLHSHTYRKSDRFHGMRVVVLGARASGVDIADEVAAVASEVILSHNLQEPIIGSFPDNLRQKPGISTIGPRTVTFLDQSTCHADAIILCTGYLYDFPFLHPDCHVTTQGGRVRPLYKHIVHTEFPSMMFIDLPSMHLPFPVSDRQAQCCRAILEGRMQLPSRQEMDEAEECEFLTRVMQRDFPTHFAHHLFGVDYTEPYIRMLEEAAHIQNVIPSVVFRIFQHVMDTRQADNCRYRMIRYRILDNDHFQARVEETVPQIESLANTPSH